MEVSTVTACCLLEELDPQSAARRAKYENQNKSRIENYHLSTLLRGNFTNFCPNLCPKFMHLRRFWAISWTPIIRSFLSRGYQQRCHEMDSWVHIPKQPTDVLALHMDGYQVNKDSKIKPVVPYASFPYLCLPLTARISLRSYAFAFIV